MLRKLAWSSQAPIDALQPCSINFGHHLGRFCWGPISKTGLNGEYYDTIHHRGTGVTIVLPMNMQIPKEDTYGTPPAARIEKNGSSHTARLAVGSSVIPLKPLFRHVADQFEDICKFVCSDAEYKLLETLVDHPEFNLKLHVETEKSEKKKTEQKHALNSSLRARLLPSLAGSPSKKLKLSSPPPAAQTLSDDGHVALQRQPETPRELLYSSPPPRAVRNASSPTPASPAADDEADAVADDKVEAVADNKAEAVADDKGEAEESEQVAAAEEKVDEDIGLPA